METAQYQLQREAAARRKIESVLKRHSQRPGVRPDVRSAQIQLDSEQRIEQLTQLVAAGRNLEKYLRRKYEDRVQRLQRELQQLKGETAEPFVYRRAA